LRPRCVSYDLGTLSDVTLGEDAPGVCTGNTLRAIATFRSQAITRLRIGLTSRPGYGGAARDYPNTIALPGFAV
jgi:hypothetical protein